MSHKENIIGPWILFLFFIFPLLCKKFMSTSPETTGDISPPSMRGLLLHSEGAPPSSFESDDAPPSSFGPSEGSPSSFGIDGGSPSSFGIDEGSPYSFEASDDDDDDASSYSSFFSIHSVGTDVPPMFSGNIDLAVAGIIGAGKSTLSKKIGEITNSRVFEEPSDSNPFLARFYANQSQWSFHTQVSFIALRFKSLQDAGKSAKRIYDRCAFEDCIFARMLHADGKMEDDEYATYRDMFSTLASATEVMIPKVILFLDVSPEMALHRIHERARGMEVGIDLDYLIKLDAEYRRWLDEISKHTCVIMVNWERYMDPADLWRKVKYYELAGKRGFYAVGHN